MAKKKAKHLAGEVKDATRKVWLAGLGALAAAEEEGSRAFRTLIERGSEFERRNRPRVKKTVRSAQGKVQKAWSKVGDSFDAQVAGVLSRLGVPTREELEALNRRLDRMERGTSKKVPKRPVARGGAKKKASGRKKAAPRRRKKA